MNRIVETAMHNAARTQLLAEAAGQPKLIPHEIAQLAASQVGTHRGGYFSFQPLWDWITAAEPELREKMQDVVVTALAEERGVTVEPALRGASQAANNGGSNAGSTIGGNVWITDDVPPNSFVTQATVRSKSTPR